jgi:hypothetical protein
MKKEPHPQEIRFILARLLKIGKMAMAGHAYLLKAADGF